MGLSGWRLGQSGFEKREADENWLQGKLAAMVAEGGCRPYGTAMSDYNSKTMARKKVREAQQKVRDERELRERANIEDMATFLVSRTRLAGVDEWEADRAAQVSAEASRRRDEHRAAAAAAVARIRARGEWVTAIARLAETTVSDVRAYLKLATERAAATTVAENSPEALNSPDAEATCAGNSDT